MPKIRHDLNTDEAFIPRDLHVRNKPRLIVSIRLILAVKKIALKLKEKSVFIIFETIIQLTDDARIIDTKADKKPSRPYSIR